MHPSLAVIIVALAGATWSVGDAAETEMLLLGNNPFTRPQVLKPKPPPPPGPRPEVILRPEEVELELTATMVSENAPMVVVNGEMLALGEKIEGLKLIAVMEHRAVFTRDGRKFTFEIETPQSKQR